MSHQSQLIYLPRGMSLHEAHDQSRWVYFPTSSLMAAVGETDSGESVELGLVGREGMIGLASLFGRSLHGRQYITVLGGNALRAPCSMLNKDALPALRATIFEYLYYRLEGTRQSLICQRFHSLRQRLCRILLTAQDLSGTNTLEWTQEFLASLIGTHRPVVGELAGWLQKKQCVRYHRGVITILTRESLAELACECYDNMRESLTVWLGILKSSEQLSPASR